MHNKTSVLVLCCNYACYQDWAFDHIPRAAIVQRIGNTGIETATHRFQMKYLQVNNIRGYRDVQCVWACRYNRHKFLKRELREIRAIEELLKAQGIVEYEPEKRKTKST